MGIGRPDTPPFQLNKAVDELFKSEFDQYRGKRKPHPIMTENGVDAIPYSHEKLEEWRHTFTGVQATHAPTNLHVFGGIDDVWQDKNGSLIVVDYKATSKEKEVSIDAEWQISYKRQIEVYQWLLRQNGFDVSNTGYFVYANANARKATFDNTLEFTTKLIPYTGDDSWIEPTLDKIKSTLEGDIPEVGKGFNGTGCEYCMYARARTELTLDALRSR